MLREAREQRGISLTEAERGTRIRQRYLAALEDDNLAALPSPVYARGFLRNYALFLELDPDHVIDLFDEETQPARNRIRAARGEPAPRPARQRKVGAEGISIQPLSPEPIDTRVRYGSSYIAISLLALPLIIAFYFIYSVYAGNASGQVPIRTAVAQLPSVTVQATAVSVAISTSAGSNAGAYNTPTVYVPQAPSSPAATQPLSPTVSLTSVAQAQPTGTIPAGNSIAVKVTTTTGDAWMSVLVDGVQRFNGTMPKGTTKQWSGKNTIRIRTGRADVVRVQVNGVDIGFMGDPNNQVVEKQWDKTGAEKVIQK